MGITIRPPEIVGLKKVVSCLLLCLERGKVFLYPAIVNAQEFIGASCHVDIIRLSLGTFPVHEQVHRVIRFGFDEDIHDLEQGFT